jgi:formate dehydrogenase major subunit
VVDPRKIKITEFAEHWLRPNLGTDVAWINGMMHVIIKEDLHDKTFVEERTEKFEEAEGVVEKYTPAHVASITGIPAQQLIDAARLYAKAPAGSILYCMGITQHTTGTDNVKSLANLAMLCGNMGIRGGGVNPCAGRTTSRGPATWAACPTCLPATSRWTTWMPSKKWNGPGTSPVCPPNRA